MAAKTTKARAAARVAVPPMRLTEEERADLLARGADPGGVSEQRLALAAWLQRVLSELNTVRGMLAGGAFDGTDDDDRLRGLGRALDGARGDLTAAVPHGTPPEMVNLIDAK